MNSLSLEHCTYFQRTLDNSLAKGQNFAPAPKRVPAPETVAAEKSKAQLPNKC